MAWEMLSVGNVYDVYVLPDPRVGKFDQGTKTTGILEATKENEFTIDEVAIAVNRVHRMFDKGLLGP